MPGKSLTPDQISHAVALREAGYTVAAISERLSMSPRSLQRLFARSGAGKGAASAKLVQEARDALLRSLTSNDRIREEAARALVDDLAHARQLRQRMTEAAEHLTASDLREAALLMRAAAAYSTALKNTSDMIRQTLQVERLDSVDAVADLPELVVRDLSAEEVRELRHCQEQEDAGLDLAD